MSQVSHFLTAAKVKKSSAIINVNESFINGFFQQPIKSVVVDKLFTSGFPEDKWEILRYSVSCFLEWSS